ncbi:MAG: isoprenylcysteine carboxylmethyltransferase family protein [Rhodospirillaceae bacterium]|nr:isoprenylcysteine carboxylmethyltransferase family protein [Rhodospirillaceae bacterium]MDD9996110.1 isoprenylcysteine carboxylmethyltransferase family protein [Rhodospirillaceae bacterium]MDE0361613.1 isoprenylcysteine carboxylmethyltransferase family protein [Rhodospirillaceae bacterium]
MSHRTDDLAPGGAFTQLVRKLRYHEASRQVLAVVLMLWFSITALPDDLVLMLGTPFIVAGAALRLLASGFITKNRELATDGPYAIVRHPLYTGNIAIVSGFAVASGQWWAVVIALAFFWFYYPTAIEYEDRKLHNLFGDRWLQWAGDVPALMPTFRNLGRAFAGGWSFRKSLLRNGEPMIALIIAACLFNIIRQLP